eukprot:7308904-Heterocapsa_arctica.AAC.1
MPRASSAALRPLCTASVTMNARLAPPKRSMSPELPACGRRSTASMLRLPPAPEEAPSPFEHLRR